MDMGPEGVYRIFTIDGAMAGGVMTKRPQEPAPHWVYYVTVDGRGFRSGAGQERRRQNPGGAAASARRAMDGAGVRSSGRVVRHARAAALRHSPEDARMKLYYSTNLNPRVAVAVARHLNSPVEFIRASPRDPRQEDAFRAINPNTLVPGAWSKTASPCGRPTPSLADCLRSRVRTFGRPATRLPETVKWLSWSKHHLTAAGDAYYFENIIKPKYLGLPPDPRVIEGAEGDFHRYAKVLDDILATRRWLIEDRLTYADFRAATIMPFAKDAKMPVEDYKNILAWADRLDEIDAWRAPFEGLH